MEIETKLVPPPGFVVPDLSGAVEGLGFAGSGTDDVKALCLVARYFDTEDLALARSSITLRHRTGPEGARWTVKLPARSRKEHHLARREIDVDAPATEPPPEVQRLLAAQLRGRTLNVVAERVTTRLTQRLEAPDGTGVVEIVTDHVCGTSADGRVLEFDEIEVEQLHGRGAKQARRAVVAALRNAGCRRGRQLPKLMRVLDAEGLGPPDVVLPRLTSDPNVSDAVGYALARSVDQILFHDPRVRLGGNDEDLHQFRVALRRLRSDLSTFAVLLDMASADSLRHELGWLAGTTSARRDLDVLRARLAKERDEVAPQDVAALEELLCRCDEQSQLAYGIILEALTSERYLNLLDVLVDSVREFVNRTQPTVDDAETKQHLRRLVRRRWRKLNRRVHRLASGPTPHALHRTRIITKRYRAAVQAAAPILGPGSARLDRKLAGLQDVLGDIHDYEVAQAWLRSAAAEQPSTALVAGQMIASLRADSKRRWSEWPEAWQRVRQQRHRLRR